MKSGFDYREYAKWVKNLGIAEKEFQTWLKTFLLEQAQRVIRLGKPRTPVDTGFLRNSWYIGTQHIKQIDDPSGAKSSKSGNAMQVIDWEHSDIASIEVIGSYLQVEIGLGAEYASYIEFGQRSYQGRYMLTISVNDVQKAMPSRFDKQFKQWLKSKGVV